MSANNSAISFDLFIINSRGHDVSSSFSIFYDHEPGISSNSRIRRGVQSYPIGQAYCPDDHIFLYSRCANRNQSPQTWSLACRANPGVALADSQTLSWGECDETEFCIEGKTTGLDPQGRGYIDSLAWCVDRLNFLQLPSKGFLSGGRTGGSIQAGFNGRLGAQYSVEALLTSLDSKTLIEAQSMEVLAQTADVHGGARFWRTLNAGNQQCSHCSTIGILSVPKDTQRIKAHVELMPQVEEGILYLASVGG